MTQYLACGPSESMRQKGGGEEESFIQMQVADLKLELELRRVSSALYLEPTTNGYLFVSLARSSSLAVALAVAEAVVVALALAWLWRRARPLPRALAQM